MAIQEFNMDNLTYPGGCYAIYQGATLDTLTFFYRDLDISSYTPQGQIRDNYFEKGGNILVSFSFDPLIFGSVTEGGETFNATTIIPKLTAAETQALPCHLPREAFAGGTPIAGVNAWVYDIKLTNPSATQTIILARGFVQVLPDTTR